MPRPIRHSVALKASGAPEEEPVEATTKNNPQEKADILTEDKKAREWFCVTYFSWLSVVDRVDEAWQSIPVSSQ
jgi:hypothetical protein